VLLREFLNLYGALDLEDFTLRFQHPFLLQTLNPAETDRGREIFLLQGDEAAPLILGRGARCHIRIRDPLVSTTHAEISVSGDVWTVVDLGSTNKTFLLGDELSPNDPAELIDGGKVSFGISSHFVFVTAQSLHGDLPESESEQEEADTDTHVVATGTQRDRLRSEVERDTSPAEAPAEPPGDPLYGQLLLFCDTHDPVPVRSGKKVVVGRSPKVDVTLASKEVSRAHAEFERRSDGVYVRDLGSANGTVLGKARVRSDWVHVPVGARVSISTYQLFVGLPQEEGSSAQMTLPAGATFGKDVDATEGVVLSLADQSVADIVQQFEEGKLSGVLRIVSDEAKGQITFKNGIPHQAATKSGETNEDAVRSLLRVTTGSCLLLEGGRVGSQQMTRSFSEIILEDFLTDG
jgi:pSer/pThr/pTyr-binding forkhead associated (FHA) protein